MTMRYAAQHRRNQQGIASFIIVFSIMLILSLVVVSFGTLIRREQRQTTDRTLSTRAYYAAESGVNLALKQLAADPTYTKTDCAPDAKITDYVVDNADPNSKTEVVCVTVDGSPDGVEYSPVSTDASTVTVIGTGASTLRSLKFEWENNAAAVGPYTCGSLGSFAPAASWSCGAPILRVDAIPLAATFTRADLQNNTMTAFLYPMGAAGASGDYSAPNKGVLVQGGCSAVAGLDCSAVINFPAGANKVALRILSIYGAAHVKITPYSGINAPGGAVLSTIGTQAVIDSTGRAQDQVRRIQVRKSLQSSSDLIPDYAIQAAQGICKRMYVVPGVDATFDTSPATCDLN